MTKLSDIVEVTVTSKSKDILEKEKKEYRENRYGGDDTKKSCERCVYRNERENKCCFNVRHAKDRKGKWYFTGSNVCSFLNPDDDCFNFVAKEGMIKENEVLWGYGIWGQFVVKYKDNYFASGAAGFDVWNLYDRTDRIRFRGSLEEVKPKVDAYLQTGEV